ncbi:MAG: hypothetical protein AAB441_03725 [Patescibacteria group bacterium]
MNINKEILKTIKYFSFFAYHPTLDEIYTFLSVKIDKNKLKYTPPQYSIGGKKLNIKYQISKKKLKNWRFKIYTKLLSLAPQIKLVGLSGSISMMNAGEDDDIDLFIITAKNRLFTGRLIALVLAQILGLRRSRDSAKQFFHKNKVCLNLFFDESNLKVPKFKQTEFVGHEVLQMKPIIVKGNVYEKFLSVNDWVFKLFPNATPVIPAKAGIQAKYSFYNVIIDWIPSYEGMTHLFGTWNLGFRISNKIESILKNLQLTLINRHRTTEIITPTQLWFHPDDFEKKIKNL